MTTEQIHRAILRHERRIKSLRSMLKDERLQPILLDYANKCDEAFNGAMAHRAACPWRVRTSVNGVLANMAARGLVRRVTPPGRVNAVEGTKAAWYRGGKP